MGIIIALVRIAIYILLYIYIYMPNVQLIDIY